MNSHDESNARLQEALECVAQIHRRERRASKEAQAARTEAAELRAGLAYRLSSVVVEHLKAPRRWLRLPFALSRAYSRFRDEKRHQASSPTKPVLPAAASFHGGTRISVPLTLERQTIHLPKSSDGQELWASTIAASSAARVSVELRVAPAESAEDGRPEVSRDHVQLIAGRPHCLLTLDAGGGERIVELARTEGAFCVLTLELCTPGSPAAVAMAEAAARRAPTPWLPPAYRAAPAGRPISAQQHSLVSFSAEDLEQKLWGGFAQDAVPELEHLKCNPRAPTKERVAAAWSLTRWHYVAGDYASALANIEFAKGLPITLTPRLPLAEAQCLISLGRSAEAVELLRSLPDRGKGPDCRLLESTAVRYAAQAEGKPAEEVDAAQLAILNEMFLRAGIAPVSKRRADEPLSLANLACEATPGSIEQTQTVSVVVPAYNAEASIDWVIESLLAQTWRNLEIIVVDDFSGDRTAEIVCVMAERDSRIRLIRLNENQGAYRARNAGVREALGDLIMVHDSDDWSHPQQIELQLEALRSYPGAVGVMSQWVRVGENLEVISNWIPRGAMFELNYSSLLFERRILDELGLWDDVLISGDGEFYSRFRAVYGEEAVVRVPKIHLLALSLTRDDSLTRSEATHLKSLLYGLRWNYRDAYSWWHARLAQRHGLPFDATPAQRPFPVPLGNQPPSARRERFDLIVIADFAASCASFEAALSYCIAAAKAGQRVAAFHWRHYGQTTRVPLGPEFYETALRHGIDILSPGDSVAANVILIAAPTVLEHKREPLPAIDAGHVVVTVDRGAGFAGTAPYERYNPLVARNHLRELFGSEGIWVPISAAAARAMAEDARFPKPHAGAWSPMVDTDSLTSVPLRWRGDSRPVPVVGRRVIGEFDWPSRRAELERAYGAGQDWDVRFHGDLEQMEALLPERPPNWRLISRQSMSGVEFCRDLDVYLHYPHELHDGEVGLGLLESMALGIPAVAPPQYAAIFGDAVVCAQPREAIRYVAELWASETEYLARARAARAFVRDNCGMTDFVGRLDRILDRASARDGGGEGERALESQCA
jgi:hypothetical protein